MKFVLKEYLMLLKEDGELDSLLTDLLFSMNILPISKPQRGRQFGVDISAVGIDSDGIKKVFLFAVKQGNLTRNVWDSNPNSIRQTLNEIIDVYIPRILTKAQKALPQKIIVATNGVLEQTVQFNWNGFVDENSKPDRIEFDFWSIDKIASHIDEHLLAEQLFPDEFKILLRKTLAFIDLADYDCSHYYSLLEKLFESKADRKKTVLKTLRIVRVCFSVIFKWSKDAKNLKQAIIASERTVLLTWNWMRENDLLKNDYALDEFYDIHSIKINIGRDYFLKTREHLYVKHSLFVYSRNQLEYSLTVWEQIGILSSIALTEITEARMHGINNNDYADICVSNVNEYVVGLKHLIINNPPSKYPEYDEHLIEISLALILLRKANELEFAKNWIATLIIGFNDCFRLRGFIPLFRTDYEELAEIHLGNQISETHSSMLIPLLAEWCVILNEPELYDLVRKLVSENYPEIDLQIWFPESTSEDFLFTENMSRKSGHTKCSITLYNAFEKYREEMLEEKTLFCEEKKFSIFSSYFYYLGYLSSRHFRANPLPVYWREFLT
ncbi:hypothetical protein [Flavobacterium hydatis]|nr:hypothetical protein [Flavobacterium hydatis]